MLTSQVKMASCTTFRSFGQLLATGTQGQPLMQAKSFAGTSEILPYLLGFIYQSIFSGSACRLLYTKEALGLNGYENTRERTATQLGSMKGLLLRFLSIPRKFYPIT
jgi:hypothetical protein